MALRERGRVQGLTKFFGYPLLSQEREKLRISDLTSSFIRSIHPNKSPLEILEKRERGRFQDMPNFGRYPLLSAERESYELQILHADLEAVSERNKSPLKLWEK